MDAFNTGSTTIIIPPLTVIERQLQDVLAAGGLYEVWDQGAGGVAGLFRI